MTTEQMPLAFLAGEILRRWRMVVVSVVVCAVLTFVWIIVATPIYRASMVVTITSTDTSSTSGTLSSALSSLPLGGLLNRDNMASTPFGQYRHALDSTALAQRLQDKYQLLQVAFPDRWDPVSKTWLTPSGLIVWIKRQLGLPISQAPTALDLANYIQDHLSVEPDTSMMYVTLAFTHHDRSTAVLFMTLINKEADELVRERELDRTRADLDYLRKRFDQTDNVEYRQVFIARLSDLEQKLMLLSNHQAYAAQVFDGVDAPFTPDSPRPTLYMLLSIAIGFVVGLGAATISAAISGASYKARWPWASPRIRGLFMRRWRTAETSG